MSLQFLVVQSILMLIYMWVRDEKDIHILFDEMQRGF
jgi:hypothetical protein